MNQVIGLFSTPFMRVEKLLGADLITALVEQFAGSATQSNSQSDSQSNSQSHRLSHTQMVTPAANPWFTEAARLITPQLVEFGALLFGERLTWGIKEMWVNVLQTGGHQSIHNHANSFISGVIYLTRSHPSANTVFIKALGGRDFIFNNMNTNATLGPFNADKWIMPAAEPGDMVLFPSYLLHEVPPNQGDQRISIAFNAIPDRLDSWGYGIRFSG